MLTIHGSGPASMTIVCSGDDPNYESVHMKYL
jgi:hypothetical protein